jgi:hypothetical protein
MPEQGQPYIVSRKSNLLAQADKFPHCIGEVTPAGTDTLRGAGDQYLSLVTLGTLRSVHIGGGEFRSGAGCEQPSTRRDFHRPHPGGSQLFSAWSKPPLGGWETGTCVGKYARTCRNGRGTLQDHLRRRGGGHLEKPDRLNNLEKLPSPQLITFLYEYTATPLSPAQRLVYTVISRYCRRNLPQPE